MLQKTMPRDAAYRTALIDRLADHVLSHGLSASSLRPLAAAAGTSDRMLLYYFPDKASLIATVLQTVATRMTALLDAQRPNARLPVAALQAHLLPILLDDALAPYMQLWLDIASQAARGDPVCGQVGEAIARRFVTWLADHLEGDDDQARQHEAVALLATIEGAILLKSLGLGRDVEAAMTRAVAPARIV